MKLAVSRETGKAHSWDASCGGPRELVENGVDGYVTESLDATAFAAAIERLLNDAPLRQSMSHSARTRVENRDWQEAFTRFWALSPE